MNLQKGFQKIVKILEEEDISYMVVGGFATGYYNRYRFTADIDIVLQMYIHQIEKIVKHFPHWMHFLEGFKENAKRNIVFNLTDFETGVKYDFMVYHDTDYNWAAFQRRKKVSFSDIECFISSPEDLIISKLKWYEISKSGKQFEDLKFLMTLEDLDRDYLMTWALKLNINRYGLF